MLIPRIPIGNAVEFAVDWVETNFGTGLDQISDWLDYLISSFKDAMLYLPPVFFILCVSLLAYFVGKRNIKLAVGTAFGFFLIENMGLWELSIETLALVFSSTILALLIGIPGGILCAKNDILAHIVKPLLDFMQTMPSFVYLIPALIFFGMGNVPGMIATVVFAMPPAIRLTNLGIRQVPVELIEVADAFGSTSWQKLLKVELPLALPTIMAGVNQCIMLSLSMVVIAAMIGARGLGYQVLFGIQRINIGMGFEAGLAIVIIAVFLDRITQNLSPK
jgi:glycine betaine/proline transport system permease protein